MINSQLQQNNEYLIQSLSATFQADNLYPLISELKRLCEELKDQENKEELDAEIVVLEA